MVMDGSSKVRAPPTVVSPVRSMSVFEYDCPYAVQGEPGLAGMRLPVEVRHAEERTAAFGGGVWVLAQP